MLDPALPCALAFVAGVLGEPALPTELGVLLLAVAPGEPALLVAWTDLVSALGALTTLPLFAAGLVEAG